MPLETRVDASRTYPPGWATLQHPWVRAELLARLGELSASDPRPVWAEYSRRGQVCGIDEVVHFFFDDHDFDETDIGLSLFDKSEVALLRPLLQALNDLVERLPVGANDDYVLHPLWPEVTASASAAFNALSERFKAQHPKVPKERAG